MKKKRESMGKYTRTYLQNNLSQLARDYFVAGVNSPVRSFRDAGEPPLIVKKGKGAAVYDYEDKKYVDYILSFGALILGHAYVRVISSVKGVVGNGVHFGMTTFSEIKLARLICQAIPQIEKIRFLNSGTEAVMTAIRLARGYTGRSKIVKFTGSYHGHADYLLVESSSGMATFNIPLSEGVPPSVIGDTLTVEHGNKAALKKVFKQYGKDIAAVIIEPAGGNYGVIPPDENFLHYVREISAGYDSLLIFDEVITGFRFCYGSISALLSVEPDMVCLGKIIGGGLPVGACGGKKEIMNCLSPVGAVYQASTFAGNPIVMEAGVATLTELKKRKKEYRDLEMMAKALAGEIISASRQRQIKSAVSCYGSMFSVRFERKKYFSRFHQLLRAGGILFAPSPYEANFLSFAHKEKDISKTKQAIRNAFALLDRKEE